MRLRNRRDFLFVQEHGHKIFGKHFIIVAVRRRHSTDAEPHGRIGITVSKKIGNAATRNRLKRLVREFARHHQWFQYPMDIVIIAKRSAAALETQAAVFAALQSFETRLAKC